MFNSRYLLQWGRDIIKSTVRFNNQHDNHRLKDVLYRFSPNQQENNTFHESPQQILNGYCSSFLSLENDAINHKLPTTGDICYSSKNVTKSATYPTSHFRSFFTKNNSLVSHPLMPQTVKFSHMHRHTHTCTRLYRYKAAHDADSVSLSEKEDDHGYDELDIERLKYLENKLSREKWALRHSNENGYLSWCRNVYLASVVGAAINTQSLVPYSKDVAFVFFFMAGLNLLTGTGSYTFNLWYLRNNMDMATLTALLHMTLAILHMLLWMGAVAIYLGYVEDLEDEEEGLEIKPKNEN